MQELQTKIDSFMLNTNAEISSFKSFSKNMENLSSLYVQRLNEFFGIKSDEKFKDIE